MSHRGRGARFAAVLAPFAMTTGPWPAPSAAQAVGDGPVVLPAVEVVSRTPLEGVGVPKDRIPANVQTADSADLERSHANTITDVLVRRFGSVHVNDVQNNPFQPDINYRGFTASPLLGTPQGLSVYVDGVRINQPFGDVVSWDLIPRAAISTIVLNPGSDPLFGLNTLGGALAITTKDGLKNPGTSIQVGGGSYGRNTIEFETGGRASDGLDWYATGNRFHDQGWRDASPSDVNQLFGKLGWRSADTRVTLSGAFAHNDLVGNGLQEQRLLAADRSSVYTLPDVTRNRSVMFNLSGNHDFSDRLSFAGNAYYRNIRTRTFNGDVNDDSLDQSVYQPNAAEIAALRAAGHTGFPTAGANAANTPFPRFRCIANVLRNDEPAEKCTGVDNFTSTAQHDAGVTGQLDWKGDLAGHANLFIVGAAADVNRVHFNQRSELGYINPDRSTTGAGGFGDGGLTGGSVDGAPYDTRVDLTGRTRTWSLFATDTFALDPKAHVTLSGRYNHTRIEMSDAITPGGGPGSLDGRHTFSRFNPAAGLTYAVAPSLGLYAGYNQGARTPSVIELGCADPASPCKLPNAFAGDPPLKQVVARTVEAGMRGNVRGVKWNLGVFRTENRDDILFVADNQSGFGYFRNFGKTRRRGVEAGVDGRVAQLDVGASYTWLDATYRSTEAINGSNNSSNDQSAAGFPGVDGNVVVGPGDRIPLIPRHVFKAYAQYDLDAQWSLGVDMVAIGSSFARGNENNSHVAGGRYYIGSGRSPGYAVFNLGVDYRPMRNVKLFMQVSNLFDREYSTAAQLGTTAFNANGAFQARPFAANANGDFPLEHSTFYAPGAPRIVVVGLRYTLD